MQTINSFIKEITAAALNQLYPDASFEHDQVLVNETKPEFEGDYTIVLFPYLKLLKIKPGDLGKSLGDYLQDKYPEIEKYEIVAGFLNLTLADLFWLSSLNRIDNSLPKSVSSDDANKIMVEYSSPNTNKPLHFGHLRNNFVGWSVAEILKFAGNKVIKSNLINDRGIHICKSMIAWKRYAAGATPESTGKKGDHLVGDYYVKFNDVYVEEVKDLTSQGKTKEEAEKEAPILKEAQDLLFKWENGDQEVYHLWEKMNSWVYEDRKSVV